MEPSGGPLSARLEEKQALSKRTKQLQDTIARKPSYANSISNPSSSNTPSNRHEREKVTARQTTHNGMPAIIFKAKDYYGVMAEDCKYTLVGRFLKSRPQIDRIRSRFKELISLKGSVKIGVYDNYIRFIDLVNEED